MGGLTFLLVFLILMALVAIVPLMLRRWHIPYPFDQVDERIAGLVGEDVDDGTI